MLFTLRPLVLESEGLVSALQHLAGKMSDTHGQPVLVDVRIDYSKRTRFTEGVIRTNLKRFGIADQARLVGRALWRRLTG